MKSHLEQNFPVSDELRSIAHEAAYPFIEPDILNNRGIFPASEDLVNAELILPLSPEGQRRYDKVWELFSAAP
jgi:hypothetical protein